jgi:hypothetical protein
VCFNPDERPEDVLARGQEEKTTLSGFFAANANTGALGEQARKFTYQQFPMHFTYKRQTGCWHERRRGSGAIGRIYFISPNAGDLFYLRTLLCVVKGPKSFSDLRTYRSITYSTYRDACIARGLLEDDGEWRQCLSEASAIQSGQALRQLLGMIMQFCQPTHPDALWNEYKQFICDDLQHRLIQAGRPPETINENDIYDYGLYLLNNVLLGYGRTLLDFPPMPTPVQDWDNIIRDENPYMVEQTSYNREAEQEIYERQQALLNEDQRTAYDMIINSALESLGTTFFLSGPGGTGKTFLYTTACSRLRSMGYIVLCVASSGIASLLLPGGRTAHSMFKIPVEGLNEHSTCGIAKRGHHADMLRCARLIIWDEAGNQNRFAMEAVDRTLQDICSSGRAFGGITTVFGGDFQQTLPVVPRGSREDIVAQCLRSSPLWHAMTILQLRRNMRLLQEEDAQQYAQLLLDIGQGTAGSEIGIVDHMKTHNVAHLIQSIYDGIANLNTPPPPEYFMNRSILSARNHDVDDINHDVLNQHPGDEEIFFSADSVEHEEGADNPSNVYPIEYLRSLAVSGMPPGELRLKPGCPLLLLRNLAPRDGLCNGTRVVVLHAEQRVLSVKIMGGQHNGKHAFIPRISLSPSDNDGQFAFHLKRRQFPVRLAYAMSINKAQGQSIKYVGLDLRTPVFSHGQLYVAMSRAISPRFVKVLLLDDCKKAANIVWPEVLLPDPATIDVNHH